MKKKLNSILLVDDSEPTNFLHKIIIEEHGCTNEIHEAENGQEALDFLLENDRLNRPQPDLILLDINMHRMNGWEFLEAYEKVNIEPSSIIIVMITTSSNPNDYTKAMTYSSVKDFKIKPLTTELLDEILENYF